MNDVNAVCVIDFTFQGEPVCQFLDPSVSFRARSNVWNVENNFSSNIYYKYYLLLLTNLDSDLEKY